MTIFPVQNIGFGAGCDSGKTCKDCMREIEDCAECRRIGACKRRRGAFNGFGIDWTAFWQNSFPAIAGGSSQLIEAFKGRGPGSAAYAAAQAAAVEQQQTSAMIRQMITLGGIALIGVMAVSMLKK